MTKAPIPAPPTPATLAPSFPRIFYWITPFLACVLTLAFLEISLALVAPVPHAAENNLYYVPDPHTGFLPKASSVGWYREQNVAASINSYGLRDDEFPLAKPPGELRILVLGDSFTAGANVEQDATYAQVLEHLLSEAFPASAIQVINSGVGAWGPFQYAQYYEHYGQSFDPDMVLLGFFVGNDMYRQTTAVEETRTAILGRRVSRDSAEKSFNLTKAKILLYWNSHLVRYFLNQGRFVVRPEEMHREGALRDDDHFRKKFLAIQTRRMERIHSARGPNSHQRNKKVMEQVTRIASLANANSIPFKVIVIPDENQINPSLAKVILADTERELYDFSMPQSLLAEMFDERGIGSFDLLPFFLADARRLYMNDTHWSTEGHRLAAEKIFEEIRPWVARRLQEPR
jgi:hypothetical protein